MNSARKDHRETVLSILCGKEDWTPDKTTEYRSLAFREDGVGYFDWEFYEDDTPSANNEVDVYQKDLEDSLRTRRVAQFVVRIKLRKCKPRDTFCGYSPDDHEEWLSRRLKEVVFQNEEYFIVDLEVGNFAPIYDRSLRDNFGWTIWGLRLIFQHKSPIPALDMWNEEYKLMVDSQNWESQTVWYSRKLRGAQSGETWNFDAGG